jgi:hypothetical protein
MWETLRKPRGMLDGDEVVRGRLTRSQILIVSENMASLYWFGPPESKTLRPVLRFVLLRIAGLIGDTQGIAPSALYWPADELGSQTPGWLRPGDLSLRYTSCHILSICFAQNPPRSCLVRQVLRSF